MPVRKGKDSEGVYFQWGAHGKKNYVKDFITENCDRVCAEKKAKKKCLAQAAAIFSTGWRERGG